MLLAVWEWLCKIDWWTLISGAVIATIGLGIRALMQEPLRAIVKDARFIRLFWWLTPQRPFEGNWAVAWRVESSRFPNQNIDNVRVRRFFSHVTFRTATKLLDGSTEECVFVGRLHNNKITGRWHNGADEEHGYYGVFQVHIHASRRQADGAWAGFTNDGSIQSNVMSMRLIDKASTKQRN